MSVWEKKKEERNKEKESSNTHSQIHIHTPKCPECYSSRVWKDGFRKTIHGSIQRFLCRDCGHRFSESQKKFNIASKIGKTSHSRENMGNSTIRTTNFAIKKKLNRCPLSCSENVASHENQPEFTGIAKRLKSLPCYSSKRQICVSDGEMKNLVKVETRTEVRTSPIEEKLVNYILHLKRLGRKDSTIVTYNSYIKVLSKSNLDNPDEIALFINEHWKENSSRITAIYAYDAYLKSIDKTWNKPKYRPESKLPFIPTDEELKNILMTGKKSSIAFVTLLYETGCRTNEAERVQWEDLDHARKKIYIRASKKGNARFITASDNLLNILSRQPRTNRANIFPKRGRNSRRVSFSKRMKRLSRLTGNSRYKKIHFHTFRHCFALRKYHRTKDILTVKMLIGHKSLLTTQRYVEVYCQVYASEEVNQFVTKIADMKEERCKLINDGWEFIKNDGDDWYFRKPK